MDESADGPMDGSANGSIYHQAKKREFLFTIICTTAGNIHSGLEGKSLLDGPEEEVQ